MRKKKLGEWRIKMNQAQQIFDDLAKLFKRKQFEYSISKRDLFELKQKYGVK